MHIEWKWTFNLPRELWYFCSYVTVSRQCINTGKNLFSPLSTNEFNAFCDVTTSSTYCNHHAGTNLYRPISIKRQLKSSCPFFSLRGQKNTSGELQALKENLLLWVTKVQLICFILDSFNQKVQNSYEILRNWYYPFIQFKWIHIVKYQDHKGKISKFTSVGLMLIFSLNHCLVVSFFRILINWKTV